MLLSFGFPLINTETLELVDFLAPKITVCFIERLGFRCYLERLKPSCVTSLLSLAFNTELV